MFVVTSSFVHIELGASRVRHWRAQFAKCRELVHVHAKDNVIMFMVLDKNLFQ